MSYKIGPIEAWHRGDTTPTSEEGGYAGAASTAAALQGALDTGSRALATVDNLDVTATTVDYGQPATATLTGDLPNKTINLAIPKGMPEDVGAALVADSQASAADAAQAAQDAQTALQATFATQDEGVATLLTDTGAGPLTQAALREAVPTVLLATAHGVVGDDVTDDTAALQALIDTGATLGLPVDLEGCTCLVTSEVTLPAGAHVVRGKVRSTHTTVGESGAVTVTGGGVVLDGFSLDAGASSKFGLIADTAAASGLRVTGGHWTGSTSHVICLQTAVSDVVIRDVFISGVAYGIRVRGTVSDIVIDGVTLTDWLTYGIEVRGVSGLGAPSDVTIRRVRSSDPTVGQAGVQGVSRQTIATFGADDARTSGLTLQDVVAIGPGIPWVSGRTDNATGDQIGVQYVDNLRMSGIVSIDGGENGISVSRSVYGATLTGLHVTGNDGHGLQVGRVSEPARDVTISGGVFLDNGKDAAAEQGPGKLSGIYLQGVDRVTVVGVRSGNVVGTSQAWGLLTSAVTSANIIGNDLTDNASGRTSFSGATTFDQLIDGDTTVLGTGTGATSVYLNGGGGTRRALIYQAAGVDQWRWTQNSADNMTVERINSGTATNILQLNHTTGEVWARESFRQSGKLGFYGQVPVVKPTSVPVTAEGIHAALVTLGLIS